MRNERLSGSAIPVWARIAAIAGVIGGVGILTANAESGNNNQSPVVNEQVTTTTGTKGTEPPCVPSEYTPCPSTTTTEAATTTTEAATTTSSTTTTVAQTTTTTAIIDLCPGVDGNQLDRSECPPDSTLVPPTVPGKRD